MSTTTTWYWGSNELNNNAPTSYTVKNNTLTSAVFPLNNAAGTPVDGLIVDNIDRPDAQSQSYYVNLDGKYRVNDRLTIKAQIGYTQGKGYTPTEPAFEVVGRRRRHELQPRGQRLDWSPSRRSIRKAQAWARQRLGLERDLHLGGQGALRQGRRRLVGWTTADRSRTCCSASASPHHTRQRRRLGTVAARSAPTTACWTSPTMPFSAVNPTSYPSGYSAGALGVPGLRDPDRRQSQYDQHPP